MRIVYWTALFPMNMERKNDKKLRNSHSKMQCSWLYGRGGWCDGQNVKSKVFDITNDLRLGRKNFIYF